MAKTARGTGKDNRKKILDTAMDLIAIHGVDKTSLAMISKVSGLSKGTVYYYFATKNDLVFDIADRHMARITETILSTAPAQGQQASLEQILTTYFQVLLSAEARSRLHLYLMREAVAGNQGLKKRFQNTYARWFAMVEETSERIQGPAPGNHTRAKCLVALVDGLILQSLLSVEKPNTRKIVALALILMENPP